MNEKVRVLDTAEEFNQAAARCVVRCIDFILREKERCSIALAGGGTPRGVYRLMPEAACECRVDWAKVDFYFGDERCVSPLNENSNYNMARGELFSRIPCEVNVYRMRAEASDANAAAMEYEQLLPEKFDIILLGLGQDGHIASVFPDSPLFPGCRKKVAYVAGPLVPAERLTLTPEVISGGRQIIVMARGSEKAKAVKDAFAEDIEPDKCPARLAAGGIWFLDREAAGLCEF